MARNVTIANLVARAAKRADLVNDERVSSTDLQVLLSEMNGELQLLVASVGMRYFDTEASITITGAASYAVPTDHLATIGIERVLDSAGTRTPLTEIMIQERYAMLGRVGDATHWGLVGQTIELYPRPSTGTYKHIYIPQPPDLTASATSTNVDTVTPDGEAFLLWGMAVKAATPDDDTGLARSERDAARERLREWAQLRSFVTPRRAVGAIVNPQLDPGDWWPRG